MPACAHRHQTVIDGAAGDASLLELTRETTQRARRQDQRLVREHGSKERDSHLGRYALGRWKPCEHRVGFERNVRDEAGILVDGFLSHIVRFMP